MNQAFAIDIHKEKVSDNVACRHSIAVTKSSMKVHPEGELPCTLDLRLSHFNLSSGFVKSATHSGCIESWGGTCPEILSSGRVSRICPSGMGDYTE